MRAVHRAMSALQCRWMKRPHALNRGLLFLAYAIELPWYTLGGPQRFLRARRSAVGGMNFAALGRVMAGEHGRTAELIVAPQRRGHYIGRLLVKPEHYTPLFPLFMDDAEVGGTGQREALHALVWNHLVLPAQERLDDPVLTGIVDEAIAALAALGPAPEADRTGPILQRMVVRWMCRALLQLDLDDSQVTILRMLWLSQKPTRDVFAGSVRPFGPPAFLLGRQRRELAGIQALFASSPAVQAYSPAAGDIGREQLAELTMPVLGVAAFGGGTGLLKAILQHVPPDADLALDDRMAVLRAVLEAARLEAPVNNVNVVLGKATAYRIGDTDVVFPPGTTVAACMGLAGHDPGTFDAPGEFRPDRANLLDDILVFHSHGLPDPSDGGGRRCPGRNIAIAMGSDFLVAWRRSLEHSPSRGHGTG